MAYLMADDADGADAKGTNQGRIERSVVNRAEFSGVYEMGMANPGGRQ
jgi:hypothetical protein